MRLGGGARLPLSSTGPWPIPKASSRSARNQQKVRKSGCWLAATARKPMSRSSARAMRDQVPLLSVAGRQLVRYPTFSPISGLSTVYDTDFSFVRSLWDGSKDILYYTRLLLIDLGLVGAALEPLKLTSRLE